MNIKLFKLLVSFSLVFLFSCSGGDGEHFGFEKRTVAKGTFKLLVLDSQNKEPYKSARENMLKTLHKNGYIQGKNLKVIYATIGNDVNKGVRILKEKVKLKPDVIFVNGTVMTMAARKAFYKDMSKKFVFACVTDPIGVGVIKDFGIKHQYNFTGVAYPVPVKSRISFVKELIPNCRKIALIYADMPQGRSYRKWIENLLKTDKNFNQLQVVFRPVPLIKGEKGTERMAQIAKRHVLALHKKVDVFISPNDQLGVNRAFAQVVWKNSSKPLIGLGSRDVMNAWGASAVIYPSHESMGEQSAKMIIKLFNGKKIQSIPAEWPRKNGFAFDIKKTKKFGIKIPIKFFELAGKNIVR